MSVFSGYYLQFKLFELQNGFHCIESLGYFMIPNKALKCFMAVKDPQWTYLNLTWPSMIIYSPLLHCMLWLLFQDLWAFSIPFLLLMNCVCWMMAIAIRGYWRGHGQGHEQLAMAVTGGVVQDADLGPTSPHLRTSSLENTDGTFKPFLTVLCLHVAHRIACYEEWPVPMFSIDACDDKQFRIWR